MKVTVMKSFFAVLMLLAAGFSNAQIKEKSSNGNPTFFGRTYTDEEMAASGGVVKCATTEYEAYLQRNDPNRMSEAEFEA